MWIGKAAQLSSLAFRAFFFFSLFLPFLCFSHWNCVFLCWGEVCKCKRLHTSIASFACVCCFVKKHGNFFSLYFSSRQMFINIHAVVTMLAARVCVPIINLIFFSLVLLFLHTITPLAVFSSWHSFKHFKTHILNWTCQIHYNVNYKVTVFENMHVLAWIFQKFTFFLSKMGNTTTKMPSYVSLFCCCYNFKNHYSL